jgi:hypothetical protein
MKGTGRPVGMDIGGRPMENAMEWKVTRIIFEVI